MLIKQNSEELKGTFAPFSDADAEEDEDLDGDMQLDSDDGFEDGDEREDGDGYDSEPLPEEEFRAIMATAPEAELDFAPLAESDIRKVLQETIQQRELPPEVQAWLAAPESDEVLEEEFPLSQAKNPFALLVEPQAVFDAAQRLEKAFTPSRRCTLDGKRSSIDDPDLASFDAEVEAEVDEDEEMAL